MMKNTTHPTERMMKKITLFATIIGLAACSAPDVSSQVVNTTTPSTPEVVNKTTPSTPEVVNKTTPSTNPVELTYFVDEFTGKEYLATRGGTDLLVSDDGKRGFLLYTDFRKENGKWVYNGLSVKSTVGSCFENDEVYIIFEDGSKFDMTSWGDFKCEGMLYFDLNGKFRDKLSKPMKGIKFVNGRDFSSFEKMFTDINDKNYFINAFKALDAYNSTH